jgi:sulfide:quinone oxidoreductase
MALATLSLRAAPHVVFAAPEGASWTLPMYELALMTAHWARQRRATLRISIVTPEEAPLAIFGGAASATVEALLGEAEIDVRCGRRPGAFSHGRLDLDGGAAMPASAVVALPLLQGPAIKDMPHDPDGFVAVDDLCRVQGAERVYAAGDMTSRTIKQGGLAAQQADVVAQAIAWVEGAAPAPAPYRPVLRGLLLTGGTPRYLRNDNERGSEAAAGEPPWVARAQDRQPPPRPLPRSDGRRPCVADGQEAAPREDPGFRRPPKESLDRIPRRTDPPSGPSVVLHHRMRA